MMYVTLHICEKDEQKIIISWPFFVVVVIVVVAVIVHWVNSEYTVQTIGI